MTIRASVVICTRNRRASLALTLDSLAQQHCDVPWEVIVVANACSDGTEELVARRACDFPVPLRLESEPARGLAIARNRGVECARGELTIFTDDDVTCLPGFVAVHAAQLERSDVDGASGRILPVLPAATSEVMREILLTLPGGPAGGYDMGEEPLEILSDREWPLLPFGANMSIRRQLVLDLGGFRPDLGIGRSMIMGEETDLFLRALEGSARVVYLPDAQVEHRVQRDHATLDYYLRWWFGRGRAVVSTRRHGPLGRGLATLHESLRLVRDGARVFATPGNGPSSIEARRTLAFTRGRFSELVRR